MTGVGGVLLVAEQLRRRVPGGIGTYVRGLVQGVFDLEAAGEPVPALTLYASRPAGRPDTVAALGRPVRSSKLPGVLLTRGWDAGLLDVPGGFGVVHAPSLATPPTRRAALTVAVHDLAWRHTPDAYPRHGRRWHEQAFGRALRRAAAVVVPSEEVRVEVAAAGAPESSLRVVPLGCDHLPAPDDAGARALLGRLGIGDAFLLSVGTLQPRKNLRRLAEAYHSARPELPAPWPLVVVGPTGWGVADDPDWAARPGVVLAGPVSDGVLASLYRQARLLVYVPILEGFGLPPLEAMGTGTPVVASPMPSIGEAALVVDPADVDAIAEGICRLASDDELRAALAAKGRDRAASRTWAASARAHVAVWGSVT